MNTSTDNKDYATSVERRLRIVHDSMSEVNDLAGEHPGAHFAQVSDYTFGERYQSAPQVANAVWGHYQDGDYDALIKALEESGYAEEIKEWRAEGDDDSYIADCLIARECNAGRFGPACECVIDCYSRPILPVHILDHSGVRLSTRDFRDQWDAGQIGYIFATGDEAGQSWTEDHLRSVIECYDQVCQGNVWGFIAEEREPGDVHWHVVDSCWGFLGDPDDCGIYDHLPEEYRELFEDATDPDRLEYR